MCIIAAKPAGAKMPSTETIHTMWHGNPNGAGIMYAKDGKVVIDKGFMKLTDLERHLAKLSKEIDLTKTGVVLHFRITTHGGTRPENTHPFPITDSLARLKQTRVCAPIGVAHNGIIHSVTPRSYDISDTMEYIASQLAPLSRAIPDFYQQPDAMLLIQNAIQSKMAFLTGDGELYTTGTFIEDNGILYSNTSYKGYARYNTGTYGKWSWGETTGKTTNTAKTKGKSKKTKGKAKTTPKVLEDPLDAYRPDPYDPFDPKPKNLMWLVERYKDPYVTTKGGAILEGNDFLLDAANRVYLYDWHTDTCNRVDDATACTQSGLLAHYDPDLARLEFVV